MAGGGPIVFSTFWLTALVIGAGATVLGAASGSQTLLIALTAIVCFTLAAHAALSRGQLMGAGAGEASIAAATALEMALVWAWAALSLLLIHVFVLKWGEWWQYVLAAAIVAGLCIGFAAMLERDAAAGRRDESMLKLARYLTFAQLAGMIVAMVGLVLDAKMPRALDKPDWAASTVFFFGAAALAAISLNGLRPAPKS
jgi:hypothetical protein